MNAALNLVLSDPREISSRLRGALLQIYQRVPVQMQDRVGSLGVGTFGLRGQGILDNQLGLQMDRVSAQPDLTFAFARNEAEIAIRILSGLTLGMDSAVTDYLAALSIALRRPDMYPLIESSANRVANELLAARTTLENEVTSVPSWLVVTRAMNPEGQGSRRIPARFVRRGTRPVDPPLRWTESDDKIERALENFSTK